MDKERSPQSVIPRACHSCRIRKIRCNRQLPCSNCVTSHLVCRPGIKSSAVQLSPNERLPGEDEFRNLHERLCVVEEAIKSQTRLPIKGSESRHFVEPQVVRDGHLAPQSSMENRALSFEGASSFGQQTLLACQVSELATSHCGHPPSIMEEVATLTTILRNPEHPSPHKLPINESKRVELPPSNLVLQVLRILKNTKSLLFLFHAVQDFSHVEELCRRIYFPLEPLSASELTLFNGIFSVILGDFMNHTHDGLDEDEVRQFQSVCQENFQSGYETYEVVTAPTYQHTLTLSIALVQAQMEGNLALHASLTSVAARHCLALGYHREERMMHLSPVEAQRARRLFWRIFIFDKNLSLRLGRAPIIQDYDVDVKQWILSQDPGDSPWDQIFTALVEFSRIQAQIYQLLYSPSSNSLDASKRQSLIDHLSTSLTRWRDRWQRIDASKAYCRETMTSILEPTEVTYYSVLTILHRGANLSNSAKDIVPACFEAAQQGLRAHLSLWPHNTSIHATRHYGIWIFLYSSFTPFIVVFLHCIKDEDANDLELLKNVLDTIEQTSSIHETLNRQFDLCKALYRIAESFINDRLSTMDQRAALLDNTIALPLQPPFLESWDLLDSNLPLPEYLATSYI